VPTTSPWSQFAGFEVSASRKGRGGTLMQCLDDAAGLRFAALI